jgi:hypothetical protein
MNSRPPIPEPATEYLHHYGYEMPMWVGTWQWSYTFNRGSRLVGFYDGWEGWTFPKPT